MNTLGIRIKQLRKALGMSQQALAMKCGWESQSRIGNYEKGTRQPNLGDMEKIAHALGVSLPDLVAGKDRSEIHTLPEAVQGRVRSEDRANAEYGRSRDRGQPISSNVGWAKEGAVPVVGNAQLGNLGFFEPLDFPQGHGDGYLNIHSDDPDAYGLRVLGDSMLPRIKNGEFVLVEPNKAFYSGDEVMVRTTDGRAMIKEFIYLRDGMYRLDSVNAEHAPIHLAETEVEKIHLVGGILKSSRFLHLSQDK
ncbi:XRE family transcriptional regulator [Pseudomonas gingeri]|uniref:Helix-turn-helix transcriptional regulator n=1 Tax=Pseudomonas gingeri TaxID=117681 RepID=A0A7Y8CPE1_9PSED|nr:helix-turn-helix transcriptional regulator [Pseudomonas gingeri]NWA04788.1 helix-turn-helix transcriptional regulator [Pseudomonas gingeri]NWA17669.1 helix-turn-helix transcriptional regulator [Pseudomonas gingeri]NWA56923.1 helix-turn-helix transcriptional regulator [Pseudomonas gingeri]NWA97211.1 helix-turn-helix transcriptional regulator [Pseudomonas gingeri]NWB01737.1 helix-turn-helix transcriptional regulator [Pseudomonas gingeri]